VERQISGYVRDFWRGSAASALTPRLCASAISSITRDEGLGVRQLHHAHDGFTLNDLVSYNEKHNEANGENNNDGNSNKSLLELRRGRTYG